ncbi:MAG: SET domain-containing protein [Alphaproteobacteria bacterium]
MLLIAVELRPSAVHGIGVFAREAVRRGAVVWQFDPGVDNRHPASWLGLQPEHVRRFVDVYGVLSLDKTQLSIPGDQTLFINHSSTPNLVPRDEVVVNGDGVVAAARDIEIGEELTVDYAEIAGDCRERAARGLPLF